MVKQSLWPPEEEALPAQGICSHRGANRICPENTLAAFRRAVELGAHQVEMDVRFAGDGELVVIHDPDVDRTTGGSGEVSRMPLSRIKQLDAGSRLGPQFAGERIPTLREALDIMPRNVWLNLQVKGGYELGGAVAREVAARGMERQAFLAAVREAANGARSVCGEILICNLERQGGDLEKYVSDTIAHGDAFIQLHHLHGLPGPEQVRRLKEAGVRINYFRTNAPAELEALFTRGVDFPLVDDLEPMMAQARRLGIAPLAPVYENGGAAPAIP
ncbi:MAG: glycerophosphodiester phosphodiesterase family protein [Kiritimatiellia bacterium]